MKGLKTIVHAEDERSLNRDFHCIEFAYAT
jgi:hypothetical protein